MRCTEEIANSFIIGNGSTIMAHSLCKIVEFYGGPLDGCTEIFVAPLDSIIVIESAILPEKPNWLLRFLQTITFHRLPTRVPIYFYRLTEHVGDAGYEFVGFGMAAEKAARLGQALVDDGIMQLQLVPHEMNPH